MMSSAETIKKVRLALYMEQEEFAKKLGITKSAVSNYEKGHRKPRLQFIKIMRKLAKDAGLDLSIEDFLED